jgi:hypothetical protein
MLLIDRDNHVDNKIEEAKKKKNTKKNFGQIVLLEQNLGKTKRRRIEYEMYYMIEILAMLIE